MKVVHITRNIPVMGLDGNRIILDVIQQLSKVPLIEEQKILFPAEYIPKVPFLSERAKCFSEMVGESSFEEIPLLFCKYVRFPVKWPFILAQYPFDRKKLNSFICDADILHAHYILPDGLIAHELSKSNRKKYIVSIREGDLVRLENIKKGGGYYNIYKKVLEKADSLIAVNHNIKKFIESEFSVQCSVIPHGIKKSTIKLRNKKFYSDKKIRLVCCSQLIQRKNVNWVLDVATKLCTSGVDLELTVIGGGELEDEYRRIYSSKNIRFTGSIPHENVLVEMRKADIFILPSDGETFGMVYLEALSQGCIFIAKRNTGMDGYFSDKVDAFFVSSSDELLNLINSISEGAHDLSRIYLNAHSNLTNNFTWCSVTEKYLSLYEST